MRERMDFWVIVITLVTGVGMFAWSTGVNAQTPPPPPPPADERVAAMAAMRERHNALPDTPGTGRYPALKEEVASLPEHVVYRPANLERVQQKLGAYIFGNGACSDDGASARLHLL